MQHTTIQNRSKTPTNFVIGTDQFLAFAIFSQDDILKLIQSLDPNKSHGTNKTSVRMKHIIK